MKTLKREEIYANDYRDLEHLVESDRLRDVSAPTPVSHRIRIRLASTAHTVINFGLSRMDSTFDHCCFDVFMPQRSTGLEALIQCFVEIHHHHDAGFNWNSKQGGVTDLHRNAEVVSSTKGMAVQ